MNVETYVLFTDSHRKRSIETITQSMEYGDSYSIYQLAKNAEKILTQIDKFQISFFMDKDIPFDRKEVLSSIQIGKGIKSINNKIPLISHPAIHLAIEGIEFYEKKEVEENKTANETISYLLYTDLVWIVDSIISLISDIYEKAIEVRINDMTYSEAIKMLTIERQSNIYNDTHPKKFVNRYKDYLKKRIQDLKELIELDKMEFGIELKEIIESYKIGLEVNVKGKNLLTPLLEKDYEKFIDNLKSTLFIPSYHDISKDEKEKYFHVYLLGVLEGRLNLYNLKSNKESGFGRYDICAFPINKNHPGLLIEIKSDKTSNAAAISQIKTNNYAQELKLEGVKIIFALAINFQHKNIQIDYEVIILD